MSHKYYLLGAVVFALLFGFLGANIPKAIYIYAPTDFIVKLNSVYAENVTIGDKYQAFHVNRTVRIPFKGEMFRQMYLIKNGEERIVTSYIETRYVEKGEKSLDLNIPLPENLTEGSYYWFMSTEMTLPRGVIRNFDYRSNVFYVQEEINERHLNTTNLGR